MTKKHPPYSKNIASNTRFLVVCTGSQAWERATSLSWLHNTHKIVFPFKDDISSYKWCCTYHKEIVLFSHGILESYERLLELTREILRYGSYKVTWCIPSFNIMSFISN